MRRKEKFSIGTLDVDYIRGGGIDPFTKRFYVDPVNGSDGNSGKSIASAKKTFTAGYNLTVTNRNECLYVVGGASALAQTAIITMDHDYTSVIGLAPPTKTGGRVRFTNTVATATTGEFVISATGCNFSGLHIQYGDSATGTSVIGTSITGGRNYFQNCQFEGPIDSTVAIGGASYRTVNVGTGVQDLTFKDCQFGQRTILATGAAGATIHLAGTNNTNIVLEDCILNAYNSNTASASLSLAHGAMEDSGWILLKNCLLINHVNANIANHIRVTTGGHGSIILQDCALAGLGTLVWCTDANHKTYVFTTNAAGAAAGGAGATQT